MLDILRALGHYDGSLIASLSSARAIAAVKSFQRTVGLTVDGIIGKKETGPALTRYKALLTGDAKPDGFDFTKSQCRVWRFTYYHLADEAPFYSGPTVPMYDKKGKKLYDVSPRFFAASALEGTGKLRDGVLLNVDGHTVPRNPGDYAAVLAIARANGWLPAKAGYAGIKVVNGEIVEVRAFRQLTRAEIGAGYGQVSGRAHVPLRTVASDVGAFRTSDPKYRGKGGPLPRGTACWVPDLVDRIISDEAGGNLEVHDGALTAVDSGGGIDGNQCDLFVGTKEIARLFHVPDRMHLWYPGIEERVPFGYAFGS